MKKLLLLLAIASIMSSCKKNNEDPKPNKNQTMCADSTGGLSPCP